MQTNPAGKSIISKMCLAFRIRSFVAAPIPFEARGGCTSSSVESIVFAFGIENNSLQFCENNGQRERSRSSISNIDVLHILRNISHYGQSTTCMACNVNGLRLRFSCTIRNIWTLKSVNRLHSMLQSMAHQHHPHAFVWYYISSLAHQNYCSTSSK